MLESVVWPWLILLLPLAAFVTHTLCGAMKWKLPHKGDWLSTGAIGAGAVLSTFLFADMVSRGEPNFRQTWSVDWLSILWKGDDGQLHTRFALPMGFLVDNITVIMLVVVTWVSTLVHVFSMGYMHDDPRYGRFFSYLSIFSFSMIWLVLSDNLFGLMIGWELVGLSSYLLIGFWFEKPAAAAACKKAFITNRVGDLGMLIGILMLLSMTLRPILDDTSLPIEQKNPLSYENVFRVVSAGSYEVKSGDVFPISFLTVAGIFLFFGAVGKSAQFPLHVWLPDAMEGPTPVSALIHAATMVAAGVYMVTRCYRLFTPDALLFIAYTGGFTAIFAATIAVTANDIKKVLAYSTVSQLGFMVLGLGCWGYSAGFFHLWTHAFFKALLFLGSGAVIHALHSQDMREMGGLRHKLPITFVCMLIATCAISGFPPLSGFWSKDQILGAVLTFAMEHPQHALLPIFGFCGAALTAFYMFRLIFLTFCGKPRDPHKYEHAHPDQWDVITAPLAVLAILTLFSAGGTLSGERWFGDFVNEEQVLGPREEAPGGGERHRWHVQRTVLFPSGALVEEAQPLDDQNPLVALHAEGREEARKEHEHTEHKAHTWAMVLSVCVAVGGALVSYFTYMVPFFSPQVWATRLLWLYDGMVNKWWIDELYDRWVIQPLLLLNDFLKSFDEDWVDGFVNMTAQFTVHFSDYSGWVDNTYVDGLVNGTADTIVSSARAMRSIQTGNIKQYLAAAVIGLTVVVVLYNVIL
ncbi:MAG: NADH-quinone oxidoreductase subunit L [Planctomycetes bacterium]|nr:NADH-quinone oxidoreductase subunit L [Planctomycetota bacterium]